jgi:antitoxin HicB
MPKVLYPAIFTKEGNGYTVCFPDVSVCTTQGDSIADAYEMALDCLALCLYDLEAEKKPVPAPSDIRNLETHGEDSFVTYVMADTTVYRRKYGHRAVKKTLTIPEWLNEIAEEQSVNYSQILQAALKEKLGVK